MHMAPDFFGRGGRTETYNSWATPRFVAERIGFEPTTPGLSGILPTLNYLSFLWLPRKDSNLRPSDFTVPMLLPTSYVGILFYEKSKNFS